MSDDILTAFDGLATAVISDALDRLGIPGQPEGIRPLESRFRLAGRAFTIGYRPAAPADQGTVGDYIDGVQPGGVVVIDNGGRVDCTVWGGLLTLAARRRGIAGTVIHGACRDSAKANDLAYPVFSRGCFMRTGKDRVELASTESPISLGYVQVRPGDIVVGDADGVVVVPRLREEEVLEHARRIDTAESEIEKRLLMGTPLREARSQLQYHELQRDGRGP